MRIPDHFIYILRNLYTGQEAIVRIRHETMDWFTIGKGVHQDCILSRCLFNFYTEYIIQNAGLMTHKLEKRLPAEISITSVMHMTPLWWQKASWWEWKSWLKTQHSKNKNQGIWSHHFIANRWGNNVTDFILGGSKITADGDCSHEIRRRLLFVRKAAAAAAAKSRQSCPTLCDPIDGSPPGFPIPGILQARTQWV